MISDRTIRTINYVIQDKMVYKDTVILQYQIEYPKFKSVSFHRAAENISTYYKRKALAFQSYCRRKLYREAVEQYEYSVEHGYPVLPFEAQMIYQLTYLENCAVSLYFDQYVYRGGAHGNTLRSADTWNLRRGGTPLYLRQFFHHYVRYHDYIIRQVTKQIEKELEKNPGVYFDDYEQNVKNEFDDNQFYLTPKGIVIFFQQYAVAPYSSGIPEFLIPFERGKVMPPRCGK